MWEDEYVNIDRYILKSGDLLVVLTQSFTGVNVWSTSCLFFQPTRLVGAIAIAMGFSSTAFADQSTNATKLRYDCCDGIS
jgi:hypothetical protein